MLALGVWVGVDYGIEGVAWGTIPGLVYTYLRVVLLANKHLGVRPINFLNAVKPALMLNTLLLSVLLSVEYLAGDLLREIHLAFYLVIMSATGAVTYSLAFLFAPIPALATEANRWKTWLRMKQVGKN
jgi:hypothetical protein